MARALLLVPVALSCVYWGLSALTLARFRRRRARRSEWRPSVSLVKPVCGPERDLHENLSTAVRQDYPDYEVVFCVQDPLDAALPVVERVREEAGDGRVRIVVDGRRAGPNAKVGNILNGSARARGEVLVFSDSDMRVAPTYLADIVAALEDPQVGIACTLYRAEGATNLFEDLELLSLNADFVPAMIFAMETNAGLGCTGASLAIRRSTLDRIGGLAPLAEFLAEDFEIAHRVAQEGLRVVFVPHVAATRVELAGLRAWWRHQVYWDQNSRASSPMGFFLSVLVRGVPLALAYALVRGPRRWTVLAATLGVRLATAAVTSVALGDREGLRRLWLLPLRDLGGMATWLASFGGRTVHWRDRRFVLRKNRLVERP
jgi:ceramide glucosyltransferase